jgi:two-component system, chemotaxis family, chemotaxis protein CheY
MSKKVLVVDDSAAIRQSISFIIEQAGYSVVQGENGQDGVSKLGDEQFDLIITDVNMPVMDGIEFVRQIRQQDNYRFTPVVVLTTESQESKMKEGKEAGATGWIVKPFDADKLMSVVKKLIG